MNLPPLYRAARGDDRDRRRRDSKSCPAGDYVQAPEKAERVHDDCFAVNDRDLRCHRVGDQNSQVVHVSLQEVQSDGVL